ncbi:hypothetical protein SKUN_001291 [Spiroplasma kunkelii CR2-3x]|uniref:Uncharacterized protein n=1 Tax=Spiroplasma kunkelii CR2-3x TaxID=273035 RepID=A0A0K2JHU4_SPIKU|nr:hypothetical protein SKUN_001291 [Spiroplasma kunkelii CR2-3x]
MAKLTENVLPKCKTIGIATEIYTTILNALLGGSTNIALSIDRLNDDKQNNVK